jgi:phosphoglucosamine mutase
VLINVPGPHGAEEKAALIGSEPVQEAIRAQEAAFAGNGRVLVRPSGTEALLRVMVEAPTENEAQQAAEALAAVIENTQKN